jgi:hypothetical protein
MVCHPFDLDLIQVRFKRWPHLFFFLSALVFATWL